MLTWLDYDYVMWLVMIMLTWLSYDYVNLVRL